MINRLAEIIVNYQVSNGTLQKEEKTAYIVGYQLLIGKFISAALMLIIAAATGTFTEMLLFMIAFICLRQYAGGFHFENAEICILFSAVICAIVAVGIKNDLGGIPTTAAGIIEMIACFMIWKIAPVDSKNKRLDRLEKKVYRNRCRGILIVECLLYVLGMIADSCLLWESIMLAHIVVVLSLVVAYIMTKFFYTKVSKN